MNLDDMVLRIPAEPDADKERLEQVPIARAAMIEIAPSYITKRYSATVTIPGLSLKQVFEAEIPYEDAVKQTLNELEALAIRLGLRPSKEK